MMQCLCCGISFALSVIKITAIGLDPYLGMQVGDPLLSNGKDNVTSSAPASATGHPPALSSAAASVPAKGSDPASPVNGPDSASGSGRSEAPRRGRPPNAGKAKRKADLLPGHPAAPSGSGEGRALRSFQVVAAPPADVSQCACMS